MNLDPNQFTRIHRSTIVNPDRVRKLQPWFRGEQVLLLEDGTRCGTGFSPPPAPPAGKQPDVVARLPDRFWEATIPETNNPIPATTTAFRASPASG